jgi:hypothetical protein
VNIQRLATFRCITFFRDQHSTGNETLQTKPSFILLMSSGLKMSVHEKFDGAEVWILNDTIRQLGLRAEIMRIYFTLKGLRFRAQ